MVTDVVETIRRLILDTVIDEAVGRQDQSSGFTFQQPNTRCYGYTECAELAKLVPAKTTNNADSYTLFALVSKKQSELW